MTRSSSNRSSRPLDENNASPQTWDEHVIQRLLPWQREIFGLFLFILSTVTFLGLLGLTNSGVLAPWINLLRQFVGWGAYPLFIILGGVGSYLMLRRVERIVRMRPGQVLGLELILLATLPLSHMINGGGLASALDGRGGGLVGWALSEPLVDFLGPLLTVLLNLALFIWGVLLVTGISRAAIVRWLYRISLQLQLWSNELEVDIAERQAMRELGEEADPELNSTAGVEPAAEAGQDDDELIIIDDSAPDVSPKIRRRNARLPPLDLLEESLTLTLTPEEIDTKKQIIEQTLLDFGLPALVTEIRRGPSVTQFGVQPGYIEKPGPDGQPKQYKVRVSQIASLRQDLALALAVPRLRIEAPVPGQGIVGVEVPNAETSIVRLKPIIQSEAFYRLKSPLAVALGRDVAGAPVTTDLGKLPHLLISGTTGSGKSVCLNALITCLVINNTPETLRVVMIDPKKVELIRFNGLPHLLGKVEVEGTRVIGVLRWLAAEMDRRYELFAAAGAKQLQDYNRKVARRKKGKNLPHIAVFVDELADLMTTYPGDVERTLCRLAQMARATGIHLVVATQRPSTDVITGLIKANFPARISFSVSSSIDSRVILDSVGAEHLLGKGDMLFLPPDANAPRRVQGCFVSDREIEAVVSHWQGSKADVESVAAPWENLIARESFVSDRDEMLEKAIALAQKRGAISTSLIQRRLRVGYPRAARLMETLYEMGLVEDPKEGGKTRRTFVGEGDDPLDDYLARQNSDSE